MKPKPFIVKCATLGPIGSFKGSGTLASFVTLPIAYLLDWFALPFWLHALIIFCPFILALHICRRALSHFRRSDPPEVVIDEVIGCLVTFCAIPMSQPWIVLLGFLLFRFFDISKIGIARFERLNHAWGVMLDDVMAGVISNIILRTIVSLIFLLQIAQ